jgi:hypothetical protein
MRSFGPPVRVGRRRCERGRRGHPLGALAIDEACESLGNSRGGSNSG